MTTDRELVAAVLAGDGDALSALPDDARSGDYPVLAARDQPAELAPATA